MLSWPRDRVAEGDWTPSQYFDGSIAETSRELDDHKQLVPLGWVALIEPDPRALRAALLNPLHDENQVSVGYEVVWTHKTSERTKMRSLSDYTTAATQSKREYVRNILWPKASELLIACKIRGSKVRVTAIHLPSPALGQPFIPVTPNSDVPSPATTLQAWCAYLNSTPAVVSFLNRRQKTLDYSSYSLDQLRSIPVPDPNKVDLGPLVEAFHRLGDSELLPWPRMNECAARAELDDAVAKILDLDSAEIEDWRKRIAKEPTVSGKVAE